MSKKQNPAGVIPEGLRSCLIGPGIWMLLPINIQPEEKNQRVSKYLSRTNKEPQMYNPKKAI
jgi:hypothetical protein